MLEALGVLTLATALLQREKRLSGRMLKRIFDLDDDGLEDLKFELVHVRRLAVDVDGVLHWADETQAVPTEAHRASQTEPPPAPRVTETSAPASAEDETASPQGERRHLTVMFCDLVGSTELSTRFDPEDLQEIIRGFQDLCARVVLQFDGYVAKYMGDGVLIYFGYPQAHENDAERAVRTALALLEAMPELEARLEQDQPVELAARVGIDTGLVVVGEVIGEGGAEEITVVGETPNIAAR
ncbi:MAG: adenylate/guanylate cyclase domain-containing protein, partial [Alphaproteobacteria bacterium]